jgi:hypothetical protein
MKRTHKKQTTFFKRKQRAGFRYILAHIFKHKNNSNDRNNKNNKNNNNQNREITTDNKKSQQARYIKKKSKKNSPTSQSQHPQMSCITNKPLTIDKVQHNSPKVRSLNYLRK